MYTQCNINILPFQTWIAYSGDGINQVCCYFSWWNLTIQGQQCKLGPGPRITVV